MPSAGTLGLRRLAIGASTFSYIKISSSSRSAADPRLPSGASTLNRLQPFQKGPVACDDGSSKRRSDASMEQEKKMKRHERLEDFTTRTALLDSKAYGLTNNASDILIGTKSANPETVVCLRARVWPDGDYREFSDDGCYVGPYFR
jgi:hypothetical protein